MKIKAKILYIYRLPWKRKKKNLKFETKDEWGRTLKWNDSKDKNEMNLKKVKKAKNMLYIYHLRWKRKKNRIRYTW